MEQGALHRTPRLGGCRGGVLRQRQQRSQGGAAGSGTPSVWHPLLCGAVHGTHAEACTTAASSVAFTPLVQQQVAPVHTSARSAVSRVCHLQVAQGNVLTAELLRLSGGLPAALRDGRSRFAPVLPDFAYLKDAAAAERRIEASPALAALDDEFREVLRVCVFNISASCAHMLSRLASFRSAAAAACCGPGLV